MQVKYSVRPHSHDAGTKLYQQKMITVNATVLAILLLLQIPPVYVSHSLMPASCESKP